MIIMKRLETERLALRPLAEDDIEDFYEYLSDPELCRMYYGLAGSVDRSTAEQIFTSFCNGEKTYALVYKQEQKMIGHVIVTALELPEQEVEKLSALKGVTVAFAVSAKYQRQGFVTEALHEVIRELFTVRGYDYIHCAYFDFNHASAKLQEKLGFQGIAFQTLKIRDGEIKIVHNILYK